MTLWKSIHAYIEVSMTLGEPVSEASQRLAEEPDVAKLAEALVTG